MIIFLESTKVLNERSINIRQRKKHEFRIPPEITVSRILPPFQEENFWRRFDDAETRKFDTNFANGARELEINFLDFVFSARDEIKKINAFGSEFEVSCQAINGRILSS